MNILSFVFGNIKNNTLYNISRVLNDIFNLPKSVLIISSLVRETTIHKLDHLLLFFL